MNSSADSSSVLTAIVCVVRASAPSVLALSHIVELLDEFVDVPVLSSLPKAAASGCVHWFDRVYQRTLGSNLASPLQIDEDPLVEYTLSNAILAAVQHGHMAMVQRIHDVHPQRLPVHLLPIAAAQGDLAMFTWLLAHRTDDLCTPGSDPSTALASIESQKCCLQRAYSQAIWHKHLHIVKWLLENGYTPSDSDEKAGDAAAWCGDLEMVQWLHTSNIPHSFSHCAIDDAAKNGHLQVVQYLLTNRSEGFTSEAVHNAVMGGYDDILEALRLSEVLSETEFESLGKWAHYAARDGRLDLLESDRFAMEDATHAMSSALQSGHLRVAEWLWQRHNVRLDSWRAALYGHLHILQWMHHHKVFGSSNWGVTTMTCAARNGHLTVVQWLHVHRPDDGCTTEAMDDASANGDFEMVQWLHANRPEGCTTGAMDDASMNGHLGVVQWLHENRTEGCTTNAMAHAAKNGHLEIVQFLHCHRSEGCTVRAMDLAARHNHQQVVEWLHVHRAEGCTTKAMTEAAINGHLEMVIWLHDHRHERCTAAAMQYAPLSVLKWLHFNRPDDWTTGTALLMDRVALFGEIGTLEFLHQHRTEGCSNDAATSAATHGHLPIVRWLHEKYPRQFDGAKIATHARHNGHHHIVDWVADQQLCGQ